MKTMLLLSIVAAFTCLQVAHSQWLRSYGSSPTSMVGAGDSIFLFDYNGFSVSPDQGNSWLPPDTLLKQYFSQLVIWRDTLYAGSPGIFRSGDHGSTWSELDTKPMHGEVYCFMVDARGLFAGTHRYGFWRSTDFAASWVRSDSGVQDPKEWRQWQTIASHDSVIYQRRPHWRRTTRIHSATAARSRSHSHRECGRLSACILCSEEK